VTDYKVDAGSTILPQLDNVDSRGFASRFMIDTRDVLASRGDYLHVEAYSAELWLGAESSYQRAEFFAQHALPIGGNPLYFELAGGSDFDSNAPAYDLFTLGGLGQWAACSIRNCAAMNTSSGASRIFAS
jgi:hypothetical protein